MDCTQTRNLLSEYADGLLDIETRADMERHLSSCAECRKDLSALRSLIDDLRSLPPVAPPSDFLRQFHKRMEQPARLRRVLGKFFFPVKFKIPLQLAGAALAALLVFSVYTVQKEQHKITGPPQVLKSEGTEKKRQVTRADKAVGTVEKPASRAGELKKRELIELTLLIRKTEPAPKPAPESAAPAPTQTFAGKAAEAEKALRTPRAATRTAPAEESAKDKGMDDPVIKVIEASQGRILSVENERQKGQATFILAEIPSAKLPSLVDDLRQLGKIDVPPFVPSDEVQGPVRIRVRIVAGE